MICSVQIKSNVFNPSFVELFLMDFFCSWQISLAWSHLAWSRGKFPRSRSAPPPSTTPTGRPNARVSTTRRTAGRPQTTPYGSGSRFVYIFFSCGEFLKFSRPKLCHVAPRFRVWSQRLLTRGETVFLRLNLTRTAETELTSGLNIVHSFVPLSLHVIRTQKENKKIRQHALFIETCPFCTADMSGLRCGIWRSSWQSLSVEMFEFTEHIWDFIRYSVCLKHCCSGLRRKRSRKLTLIHHETTFFALFLHKRKTCKVLILYVFSQEIKILQRQFFPISCSPVSYTHQGHNKLFQLKKNT